MAIRPLHYSDTCLYILNVQTVTPLVWAPCDGSRSIATPPGMLVCDKLSRGGILLGLSEPSYTPGSHFSKVLKGFHAREAMQNLKPFVYRAV